MSDERILSEGESRKIKFEKLFGTLFIVIIVILGCMFEEVAALSNFEDELFLL